jgi:hypothetical protein
VPGWGRRTDKTGLEVIHQLVITNHYIKKIDGIPYFNGSSGQINDLLVVKMVGIVMAGDVAH